MKEIIYNKTHRKHTLIKTFGMTALALLMLVSIAGAAPFAYVVDWDKNFVVIDTATNTITATVHGNFEGSGVAVNPAGTKVYVTNSKSNTISVIDTATNKVTATVKVGNGPCGVAVNPAGTKVYVTNSKSNTISVIDTATNKITATAKVGIGPYGVAVNPNGKKVYVTNLGSYDDPSNTVSVISTATNKVTATVKVGNGPCEVAVSPNGKKVYVANSYKNTVSVIDTATDKVTATVKVGNNPCGVAVSPNGKKVYVPCSTTPNEFGEIGLVSVIDTATNKVTVNIEDGVSTGGAAVTPDGKKVYVINFGHTGVGYGLSVIDTATNKRTAFVYYEGPIDAFGQFIGPSVTPPTKPVAAFSASPTSGSKPLVVTFTDKSTNNPTSWKWNFGDGTTSTTHNPVHTYIKTGSHTVTLTATNSAGSNKVTKSSYIKVTDPVKPVAAFSASPTSGTKPLKVQFTDKSTGSPTSWKWDFGDGTTSTTHNPLHTYIKKGKLTVKLTVKNVAGSNTKTMSNYITVKIK
ncbi:MAG: PKD domain-containing protein [Methanosarcina vacuolata]|nr:PKD domain-containing protein [Methanosarcina vacuolata]